VYSGSFQVLGEPERAHAEAFTYAFGATAVSFTDDWYNSLDQPGGAFSFTRTQTATGYTLGGSGAQTYFRSGFAPATVSYNLTNGSVNLTPGAATETYTVTSGALSSVWMWNGLANLGNTATGSVTSAGQPSATFTIDTSGDVTLTQLNGNIQQFLL
jgi:hypothetical protein